jgi:AraC family transcriptional regulator
LQRSPPLVRSGKSAIARLVAAALGETPGAFRRRLLLERAAWEIRAGSSITEAGFAAG